jgi:branched-chain amino acid transport system permease protein
MKRALWAGVLVLAVLLPFFFSSYRVSQFTLVLAYAVAALGLNLLLGYSGQISLGHGAFFALGAYTTAILVAKSGWPHLATIPVAAAVCFAAGFAVGIPALRLHGLYLALVTLGLAVATPQLIKRFDGLTGGTQGLSAPPPAVPGFLDFLADDQWLYLLNLAIAIPMFVLAVGLVRGKVGRALIAIRDNELAAKTFGVNLAIAVVMFVLAAGIVRGRVGRALVAVRDNQIAARTFGVDLAAYKTRAFAISAAYAGVGGAMFAISIGFIAPESFGLALSFSFLAAIVVGGLATVSGAIFGALFIEFVPVYAADVNEALAAVIYGGVLIVFMYVLPSGVVGLLKRIRPRAQGGKHAVVIDRGAADAGAGERVRAGR